MPEKRPSLPFESYMPQLNSPTNGRARAHAAEVLALLRADSVEGVLEVGGGSGAAGEGSVKMISKAGSKMRSKVK